MTITLYYVGRAGIPVGGSIPQIPYVRGLDPDDPQALREAVLESIRSAEFPDRPSRNDVVFTWESEAQAERWRSEGVTELGKPIGFEAIYVVAPALDAKTFRGDYGWLSLTARDLDELGHRARSYWSGATRAGNSAWEVLVSGALVVEAIRGVGDTARAT
jgi:hypothetical protein